MLQYFCVSASFPSPSKVGYTSLATSKVFRVKKDLATHSCIEFNSPFAAELPNIMEGDQVDSLKEPKVAEGAEEVDETWSSPEAVSS